MIFRVGNLIENTKIKVSIQHNSEKTIKYLEPSCGCMDVKFVSRDNTIQLTYSAGILDARTIKTQGYQEIHKYIMIYYTDDTSVKVLVNGKIYPKNK